MTHRHRSVAKATTFLVLLLLSSPPYGHAQDSGVVPGSLDIIQLRNNSGQSLSFYIREQSNWQEYELASGGEVEIPQERVLFSIPTTTDDTADPSRPPEVSPGELAGVSTSGEGFRRMGSHFVRELRKGQRWELCWSRSRGVWVAQRFREGLCD